MDGIAGRNNMKTPNIYSENPVLLQPEERKKDKTRKLGS